MLIGIEDGEALPPASQRVSPELLDRLRKRIGELTVNVQVLPQLITAENGGQFVELSISRAPGVASTTDGRYFPRVSDACRPVVGDDVRRLANERVAYPWESMTTLQVPRQQVDAAKLRLFCDGIRASDRVKESVKRKTDEELLDHYLLVHGDFLTNLGVLVAGCRTDRARLGTALIIQFIKYDEAGAKVHKLFWDDYSLTPMEMGLYCQHDSLTAIQLTRLLELKDSGQLPSWLDRLLNWEIVKSKGKTKGTVYFVNPDLLRKLDFKGSTTLKGIEEHRLHELVLRDLEIYKQAGISEIHARIGEEIPLRHLREQLRRMVERGEIGKKGKVRHTRYLWTKEP